MELTKTKFKQTELGLIPEDWELKLLKDITNDMLQGVNTAIDIPEYVRSGTPMLKANDVIDGVIDFGDVDCISERTYSKYSKRFRAMKGDFLFSNIGARLGTGALLREEVECSFAWNVMRIIPNQEKIYPEFLSFSINSPRFYKIIISNQTGSGMGFVPKNILRNLQIPLPPLPEQKAIAQVLSDTDSLIQTLEQKLTKKRAVKQGAMQQLLTPKEDWEILSFPEVCWFQEGPGVRKHQFTTKGVKLLNGTNIERGNLVLDKTNTHISYDEAYGWYSHFLVDAGDILIACSGITINKFEEKVTIANKDHLPLCMNTSTMRFKVKNENLNKNFLFHFLKSDSFKSQIGGKATGSAQLNFGPSHVSKVSIDLPKPNLQNEIATILSDMDAEIAQLEEKLDKYKLLKQGLMQELLTGRIRLV